MSTLSARDHRLVRDLVARLRQLEHGSGPALSELVPAVADLVGGGKPASYAVRIEEQGYDLDFLYSRGMAGSEAECGQIWGDAVRNGPPRGLLYTPARPERSQRNRAFLLPRQHEMLAKPALLGPTGLTAPKDLSPFASQLEAFRRLGIHQDYAVRALVCEGDALLAWIGVYRPDPFTPRDQQLLQALVPALRARLSLEKQLELSIFAHGAIGVLIEQIAGPAALVTPQGRILACNAPLRAELERDGSGTKEALVNSVKGLHPFAKVTKISALGAPDSRLVVFPQPSAPEQRLERVCSRHALTPRQTEVLRMLVRGASNRVIAATLDCAERTVEIHVTAILSKLGVESRAAALARVYADD